jgi:outer membrane lipoprotein-sorting protein
VTVTGVVIAAAAVASAAAVPSLPSRTAEQLLTEAAQAKAPGPLTATVQETSDLGLPSLPAALQQQSGASGLATGNQSVTIWYRDSRHIRVAQPVQDGETDARLDGRTLWVWSSKSQTATRYALPARFTGLPGQAGTGPQAGSSQIPDTPQAAAAQVLKAVGPSTVVSVQRNVYVAGIPAYQLSLVPRSSKSLVGSILIAIDASRHIPLRVEVYTRASSALAYSIGFTALTFGTPAASNFTFTPPPGAIVKRQTVPSSVQSALSQAGLSQTGLGGLKLGGLPVPSVSAAGLPASPPAARASAAGSLPRMSKKEIARIKAQFASSLPKSMSATQRALIIKQFDAQLSAARHGKAVSRSTVVSPLTASAAQAARANAPRVLGSDWLSVVATPPSPQVATAVRQLLSAHGGPAVQTGGTFSGSSSSSQAYSSTLTVSPGPSLAALRTLLLATRAVHGTWGSGRLLQTSLLTVLVTSKGQILAGAVAPAVLYADVAADAG